MTTTQPHSERAHANLGPSGSARWMTCPGSVQVIADFTAKYPNKRSSNRNADVGTIAHEACECYLLNKPLVKPTGGIHEDDEPLSDQEWDDILMHGLAFREYVKSFMDKDDILLVEKRLHMGQIHESIFGTGDVVIYKRATKTLLTIDYKYGFSYVSPVANTQLLLYLVGSENLVGSMGYEVENYEAHVYQPRVNGGIGHDTYNKQEIDVFIEKARAAAERIVSGDTTRVPSEKGCQWCPGYGTELCPESAKWISADVLGLLDDMDELEDLTPDSIKGMDVEDFTIEQLSQMFLLFGAAKKWMDKVAAHLTERAQDGTVEGLKLVEGRGSNECTSPEEVAFILGDAAWKSPALKSVTDIKRFVGAKNFDNLLGDCYRKRPGNPTLVSINDKREAITNNADLLTELEDLPE